MSKQKLLAQFSDIVTRCPFGPAFFLTSLGGLVRDRCPDPSEHLSIVELRLHSGEVLDLCHVIGISPQWEALAVREKHETTHGRRAMRTDEAALWAVACHQPKS